jgi:hypothetical protein
MEGYNKKYTGGCIRNNERQSIILKIIYCKINCLQFYSILNISNTVVACGAPADRAFFLLLSIV